MDSDKLLLLFAIQTCAFLWSCTSEIEDQIIFEDENVSSEGFNNNRARNALLRDYLETRNHEKTFDYKIAFSQLNYEDVRGHFTEHCNACHNGSGIAPFSFTNYKSIVKRSNAIRESLETMLMPPWAASLERNRFCNEQILPDEVRAMMIEWIDQGAALGEADSNVETKFITQEVPDVLVTTPKKHIITSDDNTYACFVFDPQFRSDTFVNAISYISENPVTIHHLTLFLDTTGVLDEKPDCWVCTHDSTVKDLILLDGWVKGLRPIVYSNDIGYRFPKNSKFLLQAHYDNNFKGKEERTAIGLHFIPEPSVKIKWIGLSNLNLDIKANTISTESLSHTLSDDKTIIGFGPHLHYLCKTLDVFAVTPNGERIELLFIPQWDYLLATKYILEKPILLPKGSTIYANVVFDNTSSNPVQPNNPVRDVVYEISANDEMFTIPMFYSDQPIDSEKGCVAKIMK